MKCLESDSARITLFHIDSWKEERIKGKLKTQAIRGNRSFVEQLYYNFLLISGSRETPHPTDSVTLVFPDHTCAEFYSIKKRRSHRSQQIDSNVYLISGVEENTLNSFCEVFNLKNGNFTYIKDILQPVYHNGLTNAENKLFVVGGTTSQTDSAKNVTNRIQIYDQIKDQ